MLNSLGLPIKPGDVVEVIAASFTATEAEIKLTEEYVRSLGLTPRIPQDMIGPDIVCANSDEKRFEHLKNALLAPDSHIIWPLRGGYGCARLLPMLRQLPKPSRPKLLIGFSDLTALHLFLTQEWGWKTVHGPVLLPMARQTIAPETIRATTDLIFGKKNAITLNALQPLNAAAKQEKTIETTVTGGNLALLQTSIGTFWQVDAKGKILLMEDVDEKPYRIDRMLNHLHQAGIFNGVEAIIMGDMTSVPSEKPAIQPVLERFAQQMPIPVVQTDKIGHDKLNLPLPFGMKVSLSLAKQELTLL